MKNPEFSYYRNQKSDLMNIPNTRKTDIIYEILASGKDLESIPDNKAKAKNDCTINISTSSNRNEMILTENYQEDNIPKKIVVKLENIASVLNGNTAAKKLYVLVSSKIAKQIIENGDITDYAITIPLSEMIAKGLYASEKSAAIGFRAAADAITSIAIYLDKSEMAQDDEGQEVFKRGSKRDIFQGYDIDCESKIKVGTILLSTFINWKNFIKYITVLPEYFFTLTNRGQDLLYTIFHFARINIRQLKMNGYFDIPLREIQSRLRLPSEEHNHNASLTIKKEIYKCVEEVLKHHSQNLDGNSLKIEIGPMNIEKSRIKKFLDEGYLRIFMNVSLLNNRKAMAAYHKEPQNGVTNKSYKKKK